MKMVRFFKILCSGALIVLLSATSSPCTEKPGLPAPPPTAGDAREGMDREIPDWQARLELARLLSYSQRYDESVEEYKKVLRARPDLDEARTEMARVLYWSGRTDEAFELFTDIPRDRLPESDRLVLAELYLSNEEYGKAEIIYREYLANNPGDLQVKHKMAQLLSWTEKYDESLGLYADILKSRPDDIQLRREYAYVLIWSGRHAEAIAELQKSLAR